MKALFEARVEDLGPGDLVIAECACGHSIAIQPRAPSSTGCGFNLV